MKKITLLTAFAFVAMLATTSCKKDYTCECVFDDGSGMPITTSTTIKDKKKKAEETCDKGDSDVLGFTTKCSIK